MQLIGTPNEADLDFVNENARRYIRQLPRHARQSLPEKFPHVQPLAIDLVEKMLTFDPRQRITGNTSEALSIFCFYRFFKFSLF
jgi:mitogen-activated protein kinase 6